jgi:hypothetical protein
LGEVNVENKYETSKLRKGRKGIEYLLMNMLPVRETGTHPTKMTFRK